MWLWSLMSNTRYVLSSSITIIYTQPTVIIITCVDRRCRRTRCTVNRPVEAAAIWRVAVEEVVLVVLMVELEDQDPHIIRGRRDFSRMFQSYRVKKSKVENKWFIISPKWFIGGKSRCMVELMTQKDYNYCSIGCSWSRVKIYKYF